jgi:hypothetical protein
MTMDDDQPAAAAEPKRRISSLTWIISILVGLVLAAAVVYAATGGRPFASDKGEADVDPQANAQVQAMGSIDEAAAAGLKTMRALAEGGDSGSLGVRSPKDFDGATIGGKLDVFMIRLDALKAAPVDAPAAEKLLTSTTESVVPVLIGGQVRSSITITRGTGGFEASAFGEADLQGLGSRPPGEGAFLVQVPALGLQFLGSREAGKLMLTPMVSDPRLRLETGRAVPADDVVRQLVPLAQSHDGLPM